jgi:hypothetical protein
MESSLRKTNHLPRMLCATRPAGDVSPGINAQLKLNVKVFRDAPEAVIKQLPDSPTTALILSNVLNGGEKTDGPGFSILEAPAP